ncbi:MAG TPA: hypothetical protein VGO93_00490 [Candidatus Xenobia bacterium]
MKPLDLPRLERGLLVVGLIFYWCYLPFDVVGDGSLRYTALSGLLQRGMWLPLKYSLVGPLFSAPLWWLGQVVMAPDWWCARYNFILLLIALAVLWRLPAAWVPARRQFMLLLVAASMFPAHVAAYYGEVFTALTCGLGLLLIAHGRTRIGATLLVLGAANSPSVLPAALAGLWVLYRKPGWWLIWLLPAAAITVLEFWLHRGVAGYFTGPHHDPYHWDTPFLVGFPSLLLSLGKGLLFFCPGLILAWAGVSNDWPPRVRATLHAWMAFTAVQVLFYSKWWDWSGDWFWGPRFLLLACLPAALLLATALARRLWPALTLGVLTLSMWVGTTATVYRYMDIQQALHGRSFPGDLGYLVWYVPQYTVLWRPFYVSWPLQANDWAMIGWFTMVWLVLSGPLWAELWRQAQAAFKGRFGTR